MKSSTTRPVLTNRQWQILRLIAEGMTYKAVAAHIGRSEQTVKNMVSAIHERMDMSSTVGIIWALRHELEKETHDVP